MLNSKLQKQTGFQDNRHIRHLAVESIRTLRQSLSRSEETRVHLIKTKWSFITMLNKH